MGSYTLTATTYNGSGATGQAGGPLRVSFRVVSQAVPARLTTQAADPEDGLKVYPNPFRKAFTLELGTKPLAPVLLLFLDGAGRQVFEQTVAESRQLIQPNTPLAPGLYLLQAGEGANVHRRKLLKIP